MDRYTVRVSRRRWIYQSCYVTVEAGSEREACEAAAQGVEVHGGDWEDGDCIDVGECECEADRAYDHEALTWPDLAVGPC